MSVKNDRVERVSVTQEDSSASDCYAEGERNEKNSRNNGKSGHD
ncbi:MAG: hypothetical protein OIF36_00235 [Alphaproteobacteria bacterium]|nr:hypothetical protein [Alphaproteobacteria bacterium]